MTLYFRQPNGARDAAAGVTAAPKPDAPPPGSLAAIVDAYRASPEWRQIGEATRRNYAKALEPIREHPKAGLQAATLPRAFIFKLRDEYAMREGKPTPRRANHMGDVIRLLFAWGVNHGWRKDNPALRLGRLRTGPGFRQWTAADVAQFRACDAVPEPLRRACVLGYYSGQRKQDCLAWLRSDRRQVAGGWVLFVKPLKTAGSTGKVLEIPEHPALTAALDASPHPESPRLLTRADGKPWGEDHFNHAFANAVKLAGLPAGSTIQRVSVQSEHAIGHRLIISAS